MEQEAAPTLVTIEVSLLTVIWMLHLTVQDVFFSPNRAPNHQQESAALLHPHPTLQSSSPSCFRASRPLQLWSIALHTHCHLQRLPTTHSAPHLIRTRFGQRPPQASHHHKESNTPSQRHWPRAQSSNNDLSHYSHNMLPLVLYQAGRSL